MSSSNSTPECTQGADDGETPRESDASVNYQFNDAGKLVDSEGTSYKFTTQAEYERLGERVTLLLYDLMQRPPYSMLRVPFGKLDDPSQCERVEQEERPPSPESPFVFISANFRDARQLVVLIHGSGKVRAGQWSRKLIINESLEIGSQLPYIRRCLAKGWAVLVLNTNDNHYNDENDKEREKENSATPKEHALFVWRRFVSRARYDRIAIVAHSYGGVVIANILASLVNDAESDCSGSNSARLLRSIKCACLTDAVFMEKWAEEASEMGIKVRNWVCSAKPLDEDVGTGGWKVSAGTEEHERTSHSAIDRIMTCIEECFSAN